MKKIYLYILLALTIYTNKALAQTITVSNVPTTLCANEGFALDYVASFTPNTGNTFIVQLSNSAGSFAVPTVISNEPISTATTGTIHVTIPFGASFGTGYRIRVIATLPGVIGNDNGIDININCTTRDYYWIGGTGNWSDLTHWQYTDDGGSTFPSAFEVPQPNDNVNFDTNSFPSGGTLTFDQFIDINDFYWEPGSGATNPKIVANGNTLKLKGELVLDAGVVTQFSEIQFNSVKKHIEINYGDNILANSFVGGLSFNGGGSWDLNSEITGNHILIHNGSTFSTNNYQLNINGQIWADGVAGNTFNTGSSIIYSQGLASNDMTVTGNATWHLNSGGGFGRNISVGTVIIESGDFSFGTNCTINDLIMMPGTGIIIRDIDPLSIISKFEAIGTRDKLITIKSLDPGVQATLNITPGASFTANFIAIEDNIVTGDTDYLPTNWVDNGNNMGWDFSTSNQLTGLNYYWVGGTGDWSDYSAHWAKLPGGGGFRASPPGAVDNIIFTSESFPVGGTLTVDDDVECNTMTWEAGSGATSPRLRGNNTTITMTGDLTLDNGVKRSVNFNFQTSLGETQNLDFADNVYESGSVNLIGTGTWELLSDLEISELNLNSGIFKTNNNQIDVYRIYINDAIGGISNWGTSIVNLNDLRNQTGSIAPQFNATTAIFNFGTDSKSSTYINGPVALGETNIIGESYINKNNTFASLTIEKGSTVSIEQNTTQFIDVGGDFTALGLRDQPITIKSNNPGVLASFSQTSGTNASSFLIIEDVNTIGTLSISTDYSTYNGVSQGNQIAPLSPILIDGWAFGQFLDTPLDFYWVGNSGNWSDYTNHWATSADGSTMHDFAPGNGDNVFFTTNSFTIAGQAVTLDNPASINNMTWEPGSGLSSPTITAIFDNDIFNSLTILGELKMDDGVQRNINHLIFESANTNNVDFANNIGTFNYPDVITFRGGGTWNLQNPLNTYKIVVEDATFNTNGFDIDINNELTLLSPTSIINLASSNVYLQGLNNNSGGTLNAAGASFFIDGYTNFSGNLTLNNVQVFANSALATLSSLSINNLVLNPGSTLNISAGTTLTTNTFSAVGTSGNPIIIKSNSSGNQGFIFQAAGVVDAYNIIISDNNASGADFNLFNSLVVGNPANVTDWDIITATTNQYRWIGGTGDWSDITHWEFSIDGGTTFLPATSLPGMLDDVFFTPSSFLGPGERVEIDQNAYCHNMIWTTSSAQSPTLSGAFGVELTFFGSLELVDGVKRRVQNITFESYVAGNIINMANNQTGGVFESIEFKGTGEWTLMSDLKAQEVNLRGGTFNLNGFDLLVDDWSFNSGNPIVFNAGTSHIYSGKFVNYSNELTFNKGTSILHIVDINNEESKISGPFILNDVIIEAIDASIIYSNAFNSLTVNNGVTLQLQDNTIQSIFDLSLNGLSGSPVIIESTNPGTQGTFNVPLLGSVVADYVIFTDNNAVGSATFNATNSSQISNVTGWSGLKQGQTINFLPLNDITLSETIDLGATASSGLTVTYSVNPLIGSGSISADVLTPTTAGLVAIIASQAGNATYGPAQEVVQYVHFNEGIYANELGQMKEATIAVGAANGVSEGYNTTTNKSVNNAIQAIVSPNGRLIVAGRHRVMIWNEIPSTYDVPADVVVGQTDFTSINLNPSQTILGPEPENNGFFTGAAVIGPNGELIVSDGRGVLIWTTIPTANGTPADVIIGQSNFTATAMGVAQDKFLAPVGLAVSNDGKLIIADIAANRVLIFNTIPTTNGALADVVIGQPDFTSSTAGTSDKNLNFPSFVAVSPNNELLISDIFNNRILVYNSIPTINNASADRVIGQDDFTSNGTGIAGNAFNIPLGVAVSKSGKLAITDLINARVLVYNQIPADNSIMADLVLGQPNLDTNEPVNNDEISLRDISFPFGISWDVSENLLITDTRLQRILIYGEADIDAPIIDTQTLLSPSYTMGGANQTSTITVSDRSGIASAKAFWEEVSFFDNATPTYEEVILTDIGGGSYQFDLSVLETKTSNPIGIEYYVEVTDNFGNVVTSAKDVLPVYHPNGLPVTGFGVGNTSEAYRLIATPLTLDDATVGTVFSTVFGSATYDNTKMRIFSYPGGAATTYNEATGSTNLEVGKGYFALAAAAATVTSPGGTTAFTSVDNGSGANIYEHTITLVNGWNLIGNPFTHDVVWADVVALSGITSEVDNLQTYNGAWDTSITSIKAGEGAFVLNNSESDFILKIPAKQNTSGKIANKTPNTNSLIELSWEVLFKATGYNGNEITLGGVGMEPKANFSKDQFDLLNPPVFASMKTISFEHPEFIAKSFKNDIRESASEEKWSFNYNVENATSAKHKIYWDNSYFGDNTPDLYLVDKTHFATINMKEVSSYSFSHKGTTKFEVYYGDNVMEQMLPDQLISQSPFPNPFNNEITFNIGLPQDYNYSVKIIIFNSVGKVVKSISKGDIEAGYNSIVWDGLNKDGHKIPAGLYAYSIYVKGGSIDIIESGKIIKR